MCIRDRRRSSAICAGSDRSAATISRGSRASLRSSSRTVFFAILELARIENNHATLDETITDVTKNFDLCIDMFRKPIEEKHQTLKVNKNIRYPYLYMDDARSSEITINILSNAVNTRVKAVT